MIASELLQALQDTIAPEANHLLTEPPKPSGDFGWFCREHAVITSILCHALGHPVQIVRGDVDVHFPAQLPLTCRGEHWWCTGALSEVLDLSLKLDYLGRPFTTSHAVIGVGTNGPFTVVVSSEQGTKNIDGNSPYILYTPLETLPFSAGDLAIKPTDLIPTAEAAEITARCCLHIHALLRGKAASYICRMSQSAALADLRHRFPEATGTIRTSIQSDRSGR